MALTPGGRCFALFWTLRVLYGLLLGADAEDGRADADAGGALLDCGLKVIGHADGEAGEGGAGGEGFVTQTAEMLEVWACLITSAGDVCGPGWDGHKAGRDKGGERGKDGEECGEIGRGEAVLGVLWGELDLNEDWEALVEGECGVVEAGGKLEGIDRVYSVKELCGAGGFVGLQRADEVHIQAGEGGGDRGFLLPLLHAIFTEETLAGSVGFYEKLYRVDFADGHEGDVGGVAMGFGASVGDLIVELGEIICDVVGDGHAVSILVV